MQLIPWKISLAVSLLHAIIFIAIAQLGLQSSDYGTQSVVPIQLVESKSISLQKNNASPAKSEPVLTKSQVAIHPPSVSGDALAIAPQGNRSELMSVPITPPSADLLELRNPKPPYPISSRENGEQGAVMLYACISDHGKVERLDLAQSSGHPALDRSALNTVRHWSFRPAQESGKAIPMCYRLPIRFLLSSSALLAALA
jgi:TonB family protein